MTEAGWISVQERLPEEGQIVLVYNADGVRRASGREYSGAVWGWREESDSCGCCDSFNAGSVTHWMPLPAPPAEQVEQLAPAPGEEGYSGWCWQQAMKFITEIRSPDMPVQKWVEMIHKGWMDYHELAAAVAACRDINDSGEEYSHPNADGAQALANLFGMIDPPQFDEADHGDPEVPGKESD